jgi:hypothetical protein
MLKSYKHIIYTRILPLNWSCITYYSSLNIKRAGKSLKVDLKKKEKIIQNFPIIIHTILPTF